MVTVAILGTLSSIAVVRIGQSQSLKGDGAMRVVLSQMTTARERAITERRNMRLTFTNNNLVQILREEVPGNTLTVLSSTRLEGGMTFTVVSGLPDTPYAFGNSGAVAFGTATEVKFSPDGTMVDQVGATLNGTVFLASAQVKLTARAVTVLGAAGRIRAFKWDGARWQLV